MAESFKVAVIGAGTAGLLAARELRREGHLVTLFERNTKLGGIWVYDPRVETGPLGLDPTREIVHSGLYSSLLVNLPRQLMSFLDYPFSKKEECDPRTSSGHKEEGNRRRRNRLTPWSFAMVNTLSPELQSFQAWMLGGGYKCMVITTGMLNPFKIKLAL
ncbi:hypothetical protein SLEP1_g2693 [Rubroshorea leprosula]|uniref:Flavin-containing monooxygenase n=1 Tax=Rubroshorea leprosula TaxID=152421 RepID=A0AAV5HNT3_9ROSI|nr:hypothetical protein SLEP1_g2693 [Rubroshorea leprosula]